MDILEITVRRSSSRVQVDATMEAALVCELVNPSKLLDGGQRMYTCSDSQAAASTDLVGIAQLTRFRPETRLRRCITIQFEPAMGRV